MAIEIGGAPSFRGAGQAVSAGPGAVLRRWAAPLCLGAWAFGCSGDAPFEVVAEATATNLLAESCGEPFLPIFGIQGTGTSSPWRGEEVVTEGVVTAVFQGASELGGFFLQDPVGDGDPATSDGIFVFTGARVPATVSVGERVRLRATVSEYYGQTQLTPLEHRSCGVGPKLEATPLGVPLSNRASLEAWEGMFVRLQEPLTVASLQDLGRYGEILLTEGGRAFVESSLAAEGSDSEASGWLLVDDGATVSERRPVVHLPADRPLRLGDRVVAAEGVLGFSFGDFRLHPTGELLFETRNPRPSPPPRRGALRVASFNLKNYFLTLGSRGAATPEELARQREGLVEALVGLDADVLGLVEIENDEGAATSDLVSAVNARLGSDKYAAVPTGRLGSDAIRVALLYRPAYLTPLGRPLISFGAHRRPPVAQTFRWGTRHLTVVVAHFKSRSCSGAAAAELDLGQGCFNAERTREARALVPFLRQMQERAGDSALLLLGDLNAYPGEDPLAVLGASGLRDLLGGGIDRAAPVYSYVFDGRAGRLDHLWATSSVVSHAVAADAWHINADEAPVLPAFDVAAYVYATPPYRSSDHDPVFVDLELPSDDSGTSCARR